MVEVKFQFPTLMAQFHKPTKWMWDFGQRWEKAFKKLGDFSILVGMFFMPVAFAFLVSATWTLLSGGGAQIAIMIPGVQMPGTNFKLPLGEGLLAIFLIAIFHEGMHGFMAAAHGVRSKFSLILLAIIPAAGVEIDETILKNMKKRDRVRILAAGSMGNFILALLALIIFLVSAPIVENHTTLQGVEVLNITNPEIGLSVGDIVVGINDKEVKDVATLVNAMEGIAAGEEIEIETTNGTVRGKTTEVNGKVMMGIILVPKIEISDGWKFVARGVSFLLLLVNLNIGVGIINLLPAGFLDGGRMIEDMWGKRGKQIGKVALFLLIVNLFLPIFLP